MLSADLFPSHTCIHLLQFTSRSKFLCGTNILSGMKYFAVSVAIILMTNLDLIGQSLSSPRLIVDLVEKVKPSKGVRDTLKSPSHLIQSSDTCDIALFLNLTRPRQLIASISIWDPLRPFYQIPLLLLSFYRMLIRVVWNISAMERS